LPVAQVWWVTSRPPSLFCKVWDDSVPTKPFPANYTPVSKPVPTFDAALAVKSGLMKRGVCKL
jgi:hypothetical protein